MRHFLIHIITTLFIIIFSQVVFVVYRVDAADVDKVCIDLPIIDAATIFVQDKKPKQEYKIYFNISTSTAVDISKTYAGYSWVGTGACPWCGYESVLTGTLSPITDRTQINSLGTNLNRDLSAYNYVSTIRQNINLDETVGAIIFYYEFILKSADGVNLLTQDGNKCIGSFEVASEPPDFEPVNCIASSIPQSNKPQGYYACNWIGGEDKWVLADNGCKTGYVANPACKETNKDRYYFDKLYNTNGTSMNGFCSVCEQKKAAPPVSDLKSHNNECVLATSTTNDNCNPAENLRCQKSTSSTKNICIKISATEGERCIIGENECVIPYNGERLVCLDTNRIIKTSNGMVGSIGTCRPESELEFIQCNDDKICEEELVKVQRLDARDPGFSMKDQGYVDAICDPTYRRCVFATSDEEAKQIQNQKQQELNPSVAPIVPAPPSRFIEKCDGNLSCANCVARQQGGGVFSSYQDAADAEFEYNKKVDEWKQARLDGGTYETAPTTKEYQFVYTGYIYTSLGCIDTTDNGLITRVVQIALGIIGGVILVRFLQAGMKLQGGGSPEDQAEAVEIITSAIVALLLFVMSMIVLRFIGFDVFQIFGPGTFQMS